MIVDRALTSAPASISSRMTSRVALRRRPHQRRLSTPAVAGVERRAVRDQNLGRIDFPGVRAGVERRLAIGAGRVRAHAGASSFSTMAALPLSQASAIGVTP